MNFSDSTLNLIILSLGVALVPTILSVATCYLKISIVLGMIKSALGTNSVPGVIITSAISLLITIFVMGGIFSESFSIYKSLNFKSFNILNDNQSKENFIKVIGPFVSFFKKHSGETEKKFFLETREKLTTDLNLKNFLDNQKEDSLLILIPAFSLTELREAFQMSCYLLLPFLVVDLIVASILGGMGLYMVSPVSIALPLKLLLFVSSDCWMVITKGLIQSYQ